MNVKRWMRILTLFLLYTLIFVFALGQTTQNDRWQSSFGNCKPKKMKLSINGKNRREPKKMSPECRLHTEPRAQKKKANTRACDILHRWLYTHMKYIMCALFPQYCVRKQRYYHSAHSVRFYRLLTSGAIFSEAYERTLCIECLCSLKGFTNVNPNTSETNWCWRIVLTKFQHTK